MLQRNYKLLFVLLFVMSFTFVPKVQAQMMGKVQITITPTREDVEDITIGENLYNKFQNKQVTCNQLTDNDFEKIGEFVMDQRLGNRNQHIQMNETMKQMIGEQGEETMHISLGKSVTGCSLGTQDKGGGLTMMGWNWNYPSMMSGGFGWGFGVLGFIFWVVGFIDLILLGIFLWKKIKK